MTEPRLDIERDPRDEDTGAPPVTWAMERLRTAFASRGGSARVVEDSQTATDAAVVTVAGARSRMAAVALARAGLDEPGVPEALVIAPDPSARSSSLACGADPRGLMYAILELADRVEHGAHPLAALEIRTPLIERPANAVRSVARLFCSDVEDLPWFHSEGFWRRYLSMLASQRFNRFSLTLGLGYNYNRDVSDAYLYFAYPFLVSVPGYDVRVPQLPAEERERNLTMLRFISDEADARGLDFQLGLWTHAYEWIDSPNARHTIEGLTPETHAAYCRDALLTLLETCPAIGGLTFRIHGESGVPEGSWGFWRTLFEGVAGCGRRVSIDLHAKGLDRRTLESALETGLPITVSPKFWAEHMGLPYHQASIRERERLPREDPSDLSDWHRAMRVSEGSRPFTRYGYGDFLREGRPYDVVFRLWAGTQRLLLWGDPTFAAAYGRVASIAGSQGLEWCEPLTFKGREGSGREGSRTGYAEPSLVPTDDWEKYAYTYRLFGRLTYDPDAPAEVWRRPLEARFGDAAPEAEAALASASRILPLVTVAHHPSASNNYYWPEIYTDMPIVWSSEGTRPHPYLDTPEPRRFGTVSPLDPEVFSSVVEYVEELTGAMPSGRVSPKAVAAWLERLAVMAARHAEAIGGLSDPESRRWAIDIAIASGLGRFFAGKLRAAVAYELHDRTGSLEALEAAVKSYRTVRDAWRSLASLAAEVYVDDLAFGPQPRIRGHWSDRLPAIDADLGDMERRLGVADGRSSEPEGVARWLEEARNEAREPEVEHVVPTNYRPGSDLPLVVEIRGADALAVQQATVRYRPMNQALAFASLAMERDDTHFRARIPAAALDGRYPLAYAFVLGVGRGIAWRHPGLGTDLSEQPYFVVRPNDPGPTRRLERRSEDWVYGKT